jgi:hypothetical protein
MMAECERRQLSIATFVILQLRGSGRETKFEIFLIAITMDFQVWERYMTSLSVIKRSLIHPRYVVDVKTTTMGPT